MVDPISQVVIALTIAFGGALLIERVIEAIKHILEQSVQQESLPAVNTLKKLQHGTHLLSNALLAFESAEKHDKTSEAYANALKAGLESAQKQSVTDGATETESPSSDDGETISDNFENHSAIIVKTLTKATEEETTQRKLRLFYHLAALGLGIMYASALDIRLLTLVFQTSFTDASVANLSAGFLLMDEVISGLIIAGGSQPIHVLIRFISTRKLPTRTQPVAEDQSEESKAAVQEPSNSELSAVPTPIKLKAASVSAARVADAPDTESAWQDIAYLGGVKPESLEHRNKRKGNPTGIIFHHTAMSSRLGFQAIVDEFLVNKGWSTGYHCVIMPDGTIKPFCRWDRVGNHTKGKNNRTLGVAFHGNFHTDANDNYSNHDGRFGIQQPTSAQIESGARLMALWVHLYDDISLSDIQGHREAKPGYTVCPGSNFPIEKLKQRVAELHDAWNHSPTAKDNIALFRTRPYLYV